MWPYVEGDRCTVDNRKLSWHHTPYTITLQMTQYKTNLPLEPLQCELSLHLVLDPGIRTVLPLQQGGPAVPRLSVGLHQNDPDETLVLCGGKTGKEMRRLLSTEI